MVSSDQKLANVVGGKTARACDNCVRKRARWYCAADDAFLCQSCDASVHSANPLARRHQRLRLNLLLSNSLKLHNLDKPKWHHGFTKKPRTPRFHHRPKSEEIISPLIHLVPELGISDHIETTTSGYCEEEQLLYQVPVFDPFEAELCVSAAGNYSKKQTINSSDDHLAGLKAVNNSLNGGLPSDVELAEFAADVETLLGKAGGIDEDLAGGGFLDCREKKLDDERVKVEDDDVNMMQKQSCDDEIINIMEIDQMMRESFDYHEHSPSCCLWEPPAAAHDNYNYMQLHMVKEDIIVQKYHDNDEIRKNKKLLKLDYDGIIAAWDDQRSPWTTGGRPEMDPDDCWAQCMLGGIMQVGDMGMNYPAMAMLDGGREARVSRYREKRRTRLFSKKIRYEVRKLNAEKRPRMKGRFVKRSTTS